MGRVRWKGMLAEEARALLLGSVLLLCVLSHGFDSYPPPPSFAGNPFPVLLSLALLSLVFPFSLGPSHPCWSVFLGFGLCHFLLLCWFSLPPVGPPSSVLSL